jgi:hypothetical protein
VTISERIETARRERRVLTRVSRAGHSSFWLSEVEEAGHHLDDGDEAVGDRTGRSSGHEIDTERRLRCERYSS